MFVACLSQLFASMTSGLVEITAALLVMTQKFKKLMLGIFWELPRTTTIKYSEYIQHT